MLDIDIKSNIDVFQYHIISKVKIQYRYFSILYWKSKSIFFDIILKVKILYKYFSILYQSQNSISIFFYVLSIFMDIILIFIDIILIFIDIILKVKIRYWYFYIILKVKIRYWYFKKYNIISRFLWYNTFWLRESITSVRLVLVHSIVPHFCVYETVTLDSVVLACCLRESITCVRVLHIRILYIFIVLALW